MGDQLGVQYPGGEKGGMYITISFVHGLILKVYRKFTFKYVFHIPMKMSLGSSAPGNNFVLSNSESQVEELEVCLIW